jgi:hypothetical protein
MDDQVERRMLETLFVVGSFESSNTFDFGNIGVETGNKATFMRELTDRLRKEKKGE